MTYCEVCEIADLGTHVVYIKSRKIEKCANCGTENSVVELDPETWLDEIEACND